MSTDLPNASGRLIIISGPSGAGKSTIVRRLLETCPLPLTLSVSATTRPPRPGEENGREYYFMSSDEFEAARQAGRFLECKEVFGRGVWYGTLADQVGEGLKRGRWMILEIDVEGASAVLETEFDPITIFIHPGGMEELEHRLRGRATESEDAILRRLEVASREMAAIGRYRHEVINSNVDKAAQQICQLLTGYQTAVSGGPAGLPCDCLAE